MKEKQKNEYTQRKERLRLKPQTKLSSSPFFANFVQKPRNGLLLREAGAIEMFADGECEVIFAHAVLTDDMV